jgi:hypothetical protein
LILFLVCPWHFINLRLVLVERPWVLIRFGVFTILFISGPRNVLGIAALRAGLPGNRTQLGGEIFRTRPYRPWDQLASCKKSAGSLSRRQNGRGVAFMTHPI